MLVTTSLTCDGIDFVKENGAWRIEMCHLEEKSHEFLTLSSPSRFHHISHKKPQAFWKVTRTTVDGRAKAEVREREGGVEAVASGQMEGCTNENSASGRERNSVEMGYIAALVL